MKFLVTGSAGLIGSQVVKDLTQQNHTVHSCYHDEKPEHGTLVKLDLANQNEIEETIKQIKPERIIHLAAMTGVDQCEIQQDLAMKINARATKIMATQAAKQNAFFVYVSTDYVFDGKNGMRKEDDTPNPLGFYGKSKLEGELALNKLASGWCIARTSTPFGIQFFLSFLVLNQVLQYQIFVVHLLHTTKSLHQSLMFQTFLCNQLNFFVVHCPPNKQ